MQYHPQFSKYSIIRKLIFTEIKGSFVKSNLNLVSIMAVSQYSVRIENLTYGAHKD